MSGQDFLTGFGGQEKKAEKRGFRLPKLFAETETVEAGDVTAAESVLLTAVTKGNAPAASDITAVEEDGYVIETVVNYYRGVKTETQVRRPILKQARQTLVMEAPVVDAPVIELPPVEDVKPTPAAVTGAPVVAEGVAVSQPVIAEGVAVSQPLVAEGVAVAEPIVAEAVAVPEAAPEPAATEIEYVTETVVSYYRGVKTETQVQRPVVRKVAAPAARETVELPQPAATGTPAPAPEPVAVVAEAVAPVAEATPAAPVADAALLQELEQLRANMEQLSRRLAQMSGETGSPKAE